MKLSSDSDSDLLWALKLINNKHTLKAVSRVKALGR